MNEGTVFFKMNTLMSYMDLDAFTAQKNVGSRPKYFEVLDKFITDAPGLAQTLEQVSKEGELEAFLEVIDELQDRLMEIGASPLVLEAEKVAILAREEEWRKAAAEARLLGTKILGMQEKLQQAKVDNQDAINQMPASSAVEVSNMGEEAKSRPQAAVKPEPFEKLMLLVENFELDGALKMLRSLLEFTYNQEIDTLLWRIQDELVAFDYDNAKNNLQKVLTAAQAIEKTERKSGKPKILAVDDVPDVLSTVKSILNDQYTVYGVTNHKAALKFLAGNQADLILLDIEMPDMDGFAMLSIIRRIKTYENTPVIFLTGSVSVENIKRSHDLGANDFIRKPIDAPVLLAKIEKHLAE